MCGIVGIVHNDPRVPVPAGRIRQMCHTIVHRGPDEGGYHVNGRIGLGMRRLSIIDLSTGQQPMTNEDGTVWIVFNGEIYNYHELQILVRQKGHQLRTDSDTEVILHLYEEFGADCVRHLRGMFAFAIWDGRTETLLLARDRLGIKPLYYAEIHDGLIFGSELKALLVHPDVKRDLQPEAVAEYFAHLCVPGDLSIYRQVHKLLPAHTLQYRRGHVRIARYWHLTPQPDLRIRERDWIPELQERLRDAVTSHLVSDVPVGAFLSGGLDSGAMVALMAQAAAAPVRTFTVGFTTDSGRFDERAPAKDIARRYNTAHTECLLAADVADLLPQLAQAFDEPFADSGAIPTWLICRETARHVKVALSGLGGDELFGGYERYLGLRIGDIYARIPAPLRAAAGRMASTIACWGNSPYWPDRISRFIRAGQLPAAERYRQFVSAFGNAAEILSPDLHAALDRHTPRFDQVIAGQVFPNSIDLGMFSDLFLYLPDDLLTLTDRVSMAHSLEVRVPYLDHPLLEFVARIPVHFKVRAFQKKVLFRKAVAPWVPKEHLTRAKQGFSVPLASWLKGPLRPLLNDLVHSRHAVESPYVNGQAIQSMVKGHLDGTQNHEVRLWAVLCFLEWERQSAEQPVALAG